MPTNKVTIVPLHLESTPTPFKSSADCALTQQKLRWLLEGACSQILVKSR